MPFQKLLPAAWNLFWRCRMIWFFALIAFASGMLDRVLSADSNQVAALTRYLVVGLAGLYAEAGTIYSAVNAFNHQPVPLMQAQVVLARRLFRLVAFSAFPAILSAILPSLVMTGVILLQPVQPNFSFVSTGLVVLNLAILLIYAIFYPFLFFCLCEVIIHDQPFLPSLQQGWRLFRHNAPRIVAISLLFFAAWVGLSLAGSAVFLVVQGSTALNPLNGISPDGILQHLLLSKPAEIAGFFFLSLLLDPLKRIILARIYLYVAGEAPLSPLPTPALVEQTP